MKNKEKKSSKWVLLIKNNPEICGTIYGTVLNVGGLLLLLKSIAPISEATSAAGCVVSGVLFFNGVLISYFSLRDLKEIKKAIKNKQR